jgi:carboxylate-amine ligase
MVRALDRNREHNSLFDRVGRAITADNKWRAQRHGIDASFIDPIRRTPITAAEWLAAVRELIAQDAAALGCETQIAHLAKVVRDGTSADRQVAIYRKAKAEGHQGLTALKEVVDWVAKETQTF